MALASCSRTGQPVPAAAAAPTLAPTTDDAGNFEINPRLLNRFSPLPDPTASRASAMGKHQLGIDLAPAEVASIVTWLNTLTGEIPAAYVAKPALPPDPEAAAPSTMERL